LTRQACNSSVPVAYKEYGAAVKAAIAHGWLRTHPSEGYLMFTQAGADLFA